MTATIPDWISATANVVLAIGVLWGAMIAIRRWNAGFKVEINDGPFHGVSSKDGVESPPHVAWFANLTLVSGQIAHIGRVSVERRRWWGWSKEQEAFERADLLPASLSAGESFQFFLSIAKHDTAAMRLSVHEYRSLRVTRLPFVEVERV